MSSKEEIHDSNTDEKVQVSDEKLIRKQTEESVKVSVDTDEQSSKGGKQASKTFAKDAKENLINEQIEESGKGSVSEDRIQTSSSAADPEETDGKIICVDLTDDNSQEHSPIRIINVSRDQKGSVMSEGVSGLKGDGSAKMLGKKSGKETVAIADNSKSDKDILKDRKDSNVRQKGKSVKTPKTSDLTGKKKKGITSNKKVRGVQDQEISEKKQTSLTDHFRVRRSERKLKALCENEVQLALEKQILSGIEDGLEIKVLEDKGRGIFASKYFVNGSFVCEYAGELIHFREAKEREAEYEETPEVGSYMYFFNYKDHKYCVDATKETDRLGRLLNHSKTNNNVHTKLFPINDIPHLILVASRDIEIGEELLYDYGDRSKQSTEYHPWLKC